MKRRKDQRRDASDYESTLDDRPAQDQARPHDERTAPYDPEKVTEDTLDKDGADEGYPEEQPPRKKADSPDGAATGDDENDPVARLQRERDELIDQVQRVTADYHNYIKRSDNQREQEMRFAKGDLLARFIPVLDHFDNALSQKAESNDAKALAQGLKIVRDELLKVLQQEGVARLDPDVGEVFDPEKHEAMIRQPADDIPPNHITATLQPGYTYGNRTLRAAKVAVAPGD